jgi:hypothetical protein
MILAIPIQLIGLGGSCTFEPKSTGSVAAELYITSSSGILSYTIQRASKRAYTPSNELTFGFICYDENRGP